MNFVIPLGCHCSMQPNWCQGANLFAVNEFRIIKLVLSRAVLIFLFFCGGCALVRKCSAVILPNTSMCCIMGL